MYICYIDESGHAGTKLEPNQPVEVVCGVITDLTKLSKTQREHLRTLNDLGVPELKASDAYRGRKDWAGVAAPQRDAVVDQILRWADDRSCKFVVSPIDTKKFFARKSAGCPESNRFQYPWEAGVFNVLLGIQSHQQTKSHNKGRTLVICDEQNDHSDRLLGMFEGDLSFTDAFVGHTPKKNGKDARLDQIIDVPHFSRSHLAILIQIADWAAFVVQAHLCITAYGHPQRYPGEAAKLKAWSDRILACAIPKTRTCPKGADSLCVYFRDQIRPSGWV